MPKPDLVPIAARVVVAVKQYVRLAHDGLAARMDALEASLKALPAPEKGEPGEPGPAGKDGIDGKEGPQGPPGESVRGEVGPMGPRGEAGAPGINGRDGDSVIGETGPAGKDGASVHPDTIALMVREAADKVAAALPKPKDGRDGFGLEDFDIALSDDGRTLSLRFTRGEVNVERQVKLATMIYREVWREGNYDQGDSVTWDGSIFVALRDTTDKPGNSPDWRLAVKRGRDGKDGGALAAVAREPVRLR